MSFMRFKVYNVYYKQQTSNTLLVLLELDLGDLAKHDGGVAVEERNAGETFARLELVDDEGVLGLEDGLGDLVGLEGHGGLHLLATGLLADLEDELGHLARGAAAAHEGDGGVAALELAGDVENLDLGVEVLARLEGGVLLVDHDVTGAGHVDLVETLDVHADVVTGVSLVDALESASPSCPSCRQGPRPGSSGC